MIAIKPVTGPLLVLEYAIVVLVVWLIGHFVLDLNPWACLSAMGIFCATKFILSILYNGEKKNGST